MGSLRKATPEETSRYISSWDGSSSLPLSKEAEPEMFLNQCEKLECNASLFGPRQPERRAVPSSQGDQYERSSQALSNG